MLKIILCLFLCAFSFSISAQTSSWHILHNAPFQSSRHEDIYFLNSQTGWTFYSAQSFWRIYTYKTTNGGSTWDTSYTQFSGSGQTPFFRSIGFFTSQIGIAGTLSPYIESIYRTTNSGENWTPISNHPTIPGGICGISIIDSLNAFACGAYSGSARIIKTSNSGMTWDSVNTDTSKVRSLVDCYFWSKDSGIVVGNYRSSGSYANGYAAILKTTNSGLTWERTYLSNRVGELCWKISFVNKLIGFVSIWKESGLSYILKTTDAGSSWNEIPFMIYEQEGIGFINENTGWVGGWSGPTYETTNGGSNWHQVPWGYHLNRFRFINDTIAYSVGRTVYKYTTKPIGIQQISTEVPSRFYIHQNYPNPFNPSTKISFSLPVSSYTTLKIFDVLGKEIKTLVEQNLGPGNYSITWNADENPGGIYFYKIISDNYSESRKMVLIK